MRSFAFVLATFIALAAAPAARAQPVSARSGPNSYLDLQLGGFVPGASAIDDLDASVALSGTFGALFNRYVGVEGTVGYYRAARTFAATATAPGRNESLEVVPVLASLRLVAPLKAVELSVRAGGGIHFAALDESGGIHDRSATFGFHVGGSLGFHLSPTIVAGVDVLRTFVSANFSGVATRIDGLLVTAMLGYRL
jgi:hypothetical protein